MCICIKVFKPANSKEGTNQYLPATCESLSSAPISITTIVVVVIGEEFKAQKSGMICLISYSSSEAELNLSVYLNTKVKVMTLHLNTSGDKQSSELVTFSLTT